MQSEYVCRHCHRLVTVHGEPDAWTNVTCPNCGTRAVVKIEANQEQDG